MFGKIRSVFKLPELQERLCILQENTMVGSGIFRGLTNNGAQSEPDFRLNGLAQARGPQSRESANLRKTEVGRSFAENALRRFAEAPFWIVVVGARTKGHRCAAKAAFLNDSLFISAGVIRPVLKRILSFMIAD